MKPEAQRIEIAKACGWAHQPGMLKPWFNDKLPKHQRYCTILPDYLNDLNAMHEAEKVLCTERPHDAPWVLYRLELLKLCGDALHHATAAYRAEAFLRTIGKWQEEPVDVKV